eukprot:CAMPEP_0203996386 /NCGR_PEP_ID=MMETSP0360-20130528/12695_1 /ASSEMBLY_ACC=CAM_ASM_000342 /TAXON_ID=268821 /ORGANISM="Scrippsiella Hangoei, Strain SHTV-5" /LENGTH=46 /DNA_ID= /DNA_START= /DNA_END= /DNA_ORIENTATION=
MPSAAPKLPSGTAPVSSKVATRTCNREEARRTRSPVKPVRLERREA